MKTKEIRLEQYENCTECLFGEDPNNYVDRKIKIPGGAVIAIAETIIKDGEKVPNDVVGRCGVSGKFLKAQWNEGCKRWFHGVTVVII